MQQYKDLLTDIYTNGTDKEDRTGVGTRSIFGKSMSFDLSKGFPADTIRKVAPRIAFEETMFFLRGESDTTLLEDKKINIWRGNTSREFLDSVGLNALPVGSLGRGYGVQWRHWHTYEIASAETFNGDLLHPYTKWFYNAKVKRKTTDQLVNLVEGLKNNPDGRRHIITAWNPGELDQMALPPCHMTQQYSVTNGRLDSYWLQRSVDSVYGLPYNIMSYALINFLLANLLKLQPGTLTFFGGDVHIYSNQLWMVEEMMLREPRELPQFVLKKELNTLDDLLSLEYSDIEIVGYDPHPDFKNKPAMAV